MTEVPEHLLARSRARRAGGAASGESSAPATTGDAAPAKAEAAAAPVVAETPKPVKAAPALPWVEAAGKRRKIPVWAMSALILLPVWAVVYATTNDPQSPKAAGPLTTGANVYSSCAACHGGAGQGGVGPAFANGAVVETFPEPGEHLRWVMLGTAGYQAEKKATYGATDKPVGGVGIMPAQIEGLTSEDLLAVVRHERETLGGEEFDIVKWEDAAKALAEDENPKVAEKAAEFTEIIETWKTLPPGA